MRTLALPLALALASVAAVLCACAETSVLEPGNEARLRFSRDDYCPVDRVIAARVIPLPPPPAPIANDPARNAMWDAAATARAHADPRQTIVVSGCGDRLTYACWRVPEHGRSIGAVCNEMPGTGQRAAFSLLSRGPYPATTRSITSRPDPKTMASSR